ncbi:MAG: hypothetical protein ABH896_04665 [Candidatus Jacksonbacteria bacterium]
MNKLLFKTFKSPYHIATLQSSRYLQILPYLIVLIIIFPVLFLPFRSFSVYLISQIIVFLLFPIFLWVFLNADRYTDLKLDIIKVLALATIYFSYLLILCWAMVKLFQPTLKNEYLLLNLGYIFLLGIITVFITAIFFYHRYAQKIIKHAQH